MVHGSQQPASNGTCNSTDFVSSVCLPEESTCIRYKYPQCNNHWLTYFSSFVYDTTTLLAAKSQGHIKSDHNVFRNKYIVVLEISQCSSAKARLLLVCVCYYDYEQDFACHTVCIHTHSQGKPYLHLFTL